MALNQRPGPRRVTVLGSTGSVGKSTVSLLEAAAEDTFEVVALVAGRDWQGLAAQARSPPSPPEAAQLRQKTFAQCVPL